MIDDYLHAIGYRIIATHRTDPKAYQFFAIQDKRINAFAVPGGMIGVNTGLILAADTESELAGVIAHEVAHVHLQHIARFIEHMGRVRLSNIAGLIASVILASQNPEAGSGAIAATMASGTQSLINFTRENEKEADLVGIKSLAAAGFDPQGMPQFFQNMAKTTRFYGRNMPEYLQTHPFTESRLMEASRRAKSYPYKQVPDSLEFHLIQARVKVADFDSPKKAVEYFESVLKNKTYRNKEGAQYGYALALIETNRSHDANIVIDQLIRKNPNQALFHLAKAIAQWQITNQNQAIHELEDALKNHPSNHPLTITLVNMYLHLNKNKDAIKRLMSLSLDRPKDPFIYHLLSKAYSQSNDLISSHRMEAEFRFHLGDLYGALTQLKMAEHSASNKESQLSKIRARKDEIQEIIMKSS